MHKAIKVVLAMFFLSAAIMSLTAVKASCQVPVSWEGAAHFQYNIESAVVAKDTAGNRHVVVEFSVTDPTTGGKWDILNDEPFRQGPSLSRLAIILGWPANDYQNTGAAREDLQPLPFGNGAGAALPMSLDVLKTAVGLGGYRFQVTTPTLPVQAQGTGVVAMEGRLAWPVTVNGAQVYGRAPVKNAYKYFALTGTDVVPRREVADIKKCQSCHDGGVHKDGVVIPRLSLHGSNRTEELRACVVCHNPNQTDIPYRTSGTEVSIDFKRMVHSIHAGSRLHNPFVVTGFQGSAVDFSDIRFPGKLNNCLTCHTEAYGKGTFELPLASSIRGSTIATGSVPGVSVDVNPANDLKITPTAAVCSSCHDSSKALSHMASPRSGGSFQALQSAIDQGTIRERCESCHGPGRDKDVRKVHEIEGD